MGRSTEPPNDDAMLPVAREEVGAVQARDATTQFTTTRMPNMTETLRIVLLERCPTKYQVNKKKVCNLLVLLPLSSAACLDSTGTTVHLD